MIVLCSIVIFISCVMPSNDNRLSGKYIGEVDSGVNHMSTSVLEFSNKFRFKQVRSTTSLENRTPSTIIYESEGKYQKEGDRIVLLQEYQRTNHLMYGENPNALNFDSLGVRKSALVVLDTIFGRRQMIDTPSEVHYKCSQKPNSKYIWNERECYLMYINTEKSKDSKNYCSELRNSQ